jgi:LDH2 family malate/lactate/ureidoglycolate dehydrogenase
MPRFDPADLRTAIQAIYEAKGASSAEATTVAKHQIEANLVGHDSHGVITTPQYVTQIDRGEIVLGARLEVEAQSPTTAVLSGGWGFGFVMTEQAMQIAIDKAREWGTAGVTIRHQGHMGRLGAYAETAARQGMIAMITADSGRGPKSVAPFGGRSRRLGTNPICFAIPSDLPAPIVLDMATSSVAVGKLALARGRRQQVPEGWIVDHHGDPSTDPGAFFDGGAILPLGGNQGHKGFGLSFIVEILCGVLTGLGYGVAPDGRHNDGNFIGLFDVGRFRELGEFKREVEGFVDYIRASPLATGFGEVLYPGEIEYRTSVERRRRGIEIEDDTWAALTRLMNTLGVEPPSAVGDPNQ